MAVGEEWSIRIVSLRLKKRRVEKKVEPDVWVTVGSTCYLPTFDLKNNTTANNDDDDEKEDSSRKAHCR